MNKIISENVLRTVIEIFKSNDDFCLVINNGNDWDKELPERLQKEQAFLVEIVEDTKKESYITEDNDLVLCTDFDGELYTKTLNKEDILGIFDIEKQPLLQKSFKEAHPIKEFQSKTINEYVINDTKVQNSMKQFMKNNPEMIEEVLEI